MKRPHSPSAPHDLRGFAYALAPYLLKQEWTMQLLQTQLAQAQRAVCEAAASCEALQVLLRTQAEHMQAGLRQHPDPISHRRGLMFLAQLHSRISDQTRVLRTLEERRAQLQQACIAQQRRLDGLADHRTKAEQEHCAELTRRESAEADRNWIGRMHHRLAPPSPRPGSIA